jgi:UDP-N-acetyl-D-galactosamine dehydrogenase
MNIDNKAVAVIGLGYVGLPLAVEFGKIRQVIGFDIDENRIADLIGGKDRTLEMTSKNLKDAKYLNYSSDINALKAANIFIITVPTPIDDANRPNLTPLIKASEMVEKVQVTGIF